MDSGSSIGTGRPPLFDSPKSMMEKIDEYIQGQYGKVIESDKEDEDDLQVRGYNITITGLALYLGFESRQSFYDYEEKPEFSYIIKRARLHVENAYEMNLYGKNPTGSIFALKNMGWKDKSEVEQNTTIKDETIDTSTLTDAELRALVEIQRKSRTGKA